MSILETVGALIVGLLLIAAAAFGLYSAFGKSNVATTEQNLVLLRMQTQQLFFGTNYDNLDNDVAMNAGIVPKSFIKGDSMKNAWGGDITLANDADNGQFSITLDNVPQDACIQLARFQPDSWESISVNGSVVDPTDVGAIAGACTAASSLIFTAR